MTGQGRLAARTAAWLACALVTPALLGCSATPALPLTDWVLRVDGAGGATPVTLPARLDGRGGVPSDARRFTLSAHVELPASERGVPLELVIPELAAQPRLGVDGAPASPPIRASGAALRRRGGPHVWSIDASATSDGTLDLTLEIDNEWTQSSWLTAPPRLVAAGAGASSARWQTLVNVFVSAGALVALFQIGITSLAVYLVDRRRRAYGYFAIQALTAAFYPLYMLGLGYRLFGMLDTPLLAGMFIVAATGSIYFTHGFFELATPSRRWVYAAVAACAAVALFPGPFRATHVSGPVAVGYLAVAIAYQLVVCLRLVVGNQDRTSAVFLFAAWVGLAVFATPDMLAWSALADPLQGARTGVVGLLLYPLWLSLLLSRRHIKSLNRADELNVELAGRVDQLERRRAEIEQLNAELRHQIAERSSQIFAALALAGQGRDVAPELAEGTLVQGRYRVVQAIGSGGMGAVYEVVRLSDERRLALKVARELNGVALARLAREAQTACRVTHPNIVGVIDVDVASAGYLYIVMELVEGQSLSMLHDRFGDPRWAAPILAQIAEGLAALHAADVVHRDLKPANVLVTAGSDAAPLVKISDFGISLHASQTGPRRLAALEDETRDLALPPRDRPTAGSGATRSTVQIVAHAASTPPAHLAQPSLTRTGQLPGTPAYIAPELVHGRDHVTPAADIFAFGVLAWELLARTRPFSEPPALALLDARKPPVAVSLGAVCLGAPDELVRLIDAALSLDPRLRPSAAELAAAFRRQHPWSSDQESA